ncbi:MAG TPA: dual specificity protein phosphatase [Roseiflexaceae bacterium]|nr:dual specificity protein phosphatase [Roseiflexaceae bacterium]
MTHLSSSNQSSNHAPDRSFSQARQRIWALAKRARAAGNYLRAQWSRTFGLNVSQIDDMLFVGGQFRPEQWPLLHALGIRAVLSLQEEYEDMFHGPPPERTLRLLVPDFQPPTIEQLREAVTFIEQAHADGLPVMVHCHAGVGRAPLTAAAYLIRDGRSAADVMAFLKSARPIIGLNDRQFERLREWHELYHRERASG